MKKRSSKEAERLIFLPRWVDVLITAEGNNITEITRKNYITTSHVNAIIKGLQKKGLVTGEITGREKTIHLTREGETVKNALVVVLNVIHEHNTYENTQG